MAPQQQQQQQKNTCRQLNYVCRGVIIIKTEQFILVVRDREKERERDEDDDDDVTFCTEASIETASGG